MTRRSLPCFTTESGRPVSCRMEGRAEALPFFVPMARAELLECRLRFRRDSCAGRSRWGRDALSGGSVSRGGGTQSCVRERPDHCAARPATPTSLPLKGKKRLQAVLSRNDALPGTPGAGTDTSIGSVCVRRGVWSALACAPGSRDLGRVGQASYYPVTRDARAARRAPSRRRS